MNNSLTNQTTARVVGGGAGDQPPQPDVVPDYRRAAPNDPRLVRYSMPSTHHQTIISVLTAAGDRRSIVASAQDTSFSTRNIRATPPRPPPPSPVGARTCNEDGRGGQLQQQQRPISQGHQQQHQQQHHHQLESNTQQKQQQKQDNKAQPQPQIEKQARPPVKYQLQGLQACIQQHHRSITNEQLNIACNRIPRISNTIIANTSSATSLTLSTASQSTCSPSTSISISRIPPVTCIPVVQQNNAPHLSDSMIGKSIVNQANSRKKNGYVEVVRNNNININHQNRNNNNNNDKLLVQPIGTAGAAVIANTATTTNSIITTTTTTTTTTSKQTTALSSSLEIPVITEKVSMQTPVVNGASSNSISSGSSSNSNARANIANTAQSPAASSSTTITAVHLTPSSRSINKNTPVLSYNPVIKLNTGGNSTHSMIEKSIINLVNLKKKNDHVEIARNNINVNHNVSNNDNLVVQPTTTAASTPPPPTPTTTTTSNKQATTLSSSLEIPVVTEKIPIQTPVVNGFSIGNVTSNASNISQTPIASSSDIITALNLTPTKGTSLSNQQQQPLPNVSARPITGPKMKSRPKRSEVHDTNDRNMNSPAIKTITPLKQLTPFNWDEYLKINPGKIAPKEAFMQAMDYPQNLFKTGMKLEAKDQRSNLWCLASVIYTEGLRLRLRFEGGDSMNDLFELVDSENIRCFGSKPDECVVPPMNFQGNISTYPKFLEKILSKSDTVIADQHFFIQPPKKPPKNLFEVGMKLEALDRKNPYLICPATVSQVKGEDVSITFDGWRGSFDYTCKYYSRDLFPVNWCQDTHYVITKPNGYDALLDGTKSAQKELKTSSSKSTGPSSNDVSKPKPKVSFSKPHLPVKKTQPTPKKAPKEPTTPVQVVHIEDDRVQELCEEHEESNGINNGINRFQCQRAVPYSDWKKLKQTGKKYEETPVEEKTGQKSVQCSESKKPEKERTQEDSNIEEETVKRIRLEDSVKQEPSHKEVVGWTVIDVVRFIKSDETLAKCAEVFENDEIDGKAFLLLTTDIMTKHMGFKIGPVLKINDLIERIKLSK